MPHGSFIGRCPLKQQVVSRVTIIRLLKESNSIVYYIRSVVKKELKQ